MSPLPDWVSKGGLVVGWEGGTDAVLSLHKQLLQHNITVAGYWLQDWSGLRLDPFGKRLWYVFIFLFYGVFLNLSSHIFISFPNDVEMYSCCCVLTNHPYV